VIETFINKVYHGDARNLLRALPSASIDAVITDAMYGTAKNCQYEWGLDPARGDPQQALAVPRTNLPRMPPGLEARRSLGMGARSEILPAFPQVVWRSSPVDPHPISAPGHECNGSYLGRSD